MKRSLMGRIKWTLRGIVPFFLSMALVQPVPARPQATRPVGETLKSFKGQHVNADLDEPAEFIIMMFGEGA